MAVSTGPQEAQYAEQCRRPYDSNSILLLMLEEIETLHAECSKLDKVTRILFLKGQWNRLNRCAVQMSEYLRLKGTISPEERVLAQKLIEMINEVSAEGTKTQNELARDCFVDILKRLMRG